MYSTLRAIKTHFENELSDVYNEREVQHLFYRMVLWATGLTRTEAILQREYVLTETQQAEMLESIQRLKRNEPIQYITEQAVFLDDVFYVNPHVLIPRPETEELVQWILSNHSKEPLRVLDIGTGSGIIPIALARKRPSWHISACDVSNDALVVARKNARELLRLSEVQFYYEDILSPVTEYQPPLDIIVSNPPYVLASDKDDMASNVLDYEPHLALFVADEDPLLFYRAIAEYALGNLKKEGYLYFEIHEDLADDTQVLLESMNYQNVEIHLDLQGKSRMVRAKK